jgi:hypothetical protein
MDGLSAKEAPVGPFVGLFVECDNRHSTKRVSLPSAWTKHLTKKFY